jgi:predicted small integral membrane protein
MLYSEIMAVCSEIHTKHINTAVWAERRPPCHRRHAVVTQAATRQCVLCWSELTLQFVQFAAGLTHQLILWAHQQTAVILVTAVWVKELWLSLSTHFA